MLSNHELIIILLDIQTEHSPKVIIYFCEFGKTNDWRSQIIFRLVNLRIERFLWQG